MTDRAATVSWTCMVCDMDPSRNTAVCLIPWWRSREKNVDSKNGRDGWLGPTTPAPQIQFLILALYKITYLLTRISWRQFQQYRIFLPCTVMIFCLLTDDGLRLPLSSWPNGAPPHLGWWLYAQVPPGLPWSSQPAHTWSRSAVRQANVPWAAWSAVRAAKVVWTAASSWWRGLSISCFWSNLIDHCYFLYYYCCCYFYYYIYSTTSQSCSPRDRGLGLETARDRFFAVLVLVSALPVLVLASVSKCRSWTNFQDHSCIWLLVFASYSSNKISNTTKPWSTFLRDYFEKKYCFQLFKFFLYHMFIPISAVLFFTETVFWWSWSWSWNSGLDYKTATSTAFSFFAELVIFSGDTAC